MAIDVSKQTFERKAHESIHDKDRSYAVYQDSLLCSSAVDSEMDDEYLLRLLEENQTGIAEEFDKSHLSTFGESQVEDPQADQELIELLRLNRDDTGHWNQSELHVEPLPFRPQMFPMSNTQQEQSSSRELSPSPSAQSSEGDEPLTLTLYRQAEIDQMAEFIKSVVANSCSYKPKGMSQKLMVHEVILVILLNDTYGNMSKDLRRILTFCDEKGREVSGESRHFKTLDTETMGVLWMKLKGNRATKNVYDTFARAMRVRREKSEGYFEHLESGPRSRKRVYRFGDKAMEGMDRIKRTLKQFSKQQNGFF